MGRIVGKAKYRDILLGAGLLGAALALVLWPEMSMEAMRDGLKLCGNVIIPSLFPFFVLSSVVVELGMSRYLGKLLEPVMVPLFRVNGNCAAALALGFVGGYPVGARTAIEIYQNGQCSGFTSRENGPGPGGARVFSFRRPASPKPLPTLSPVPSRPR